MPFVRRKRGQVLVVHNRRVPGGKVQQAVLHTFSSPPALAAVLGTKGWASWSEALAWQHPDCKWDWAQLKRGLADVLQSWGSRPTSGAARRENRVRQLAVDLERRLRRLTAAGAADAVLLAGARAALCELQGTLARVVEPKRGLGDLLPRESGARALRSNPEADHLFGEGMEHWWAGNRGAACRWFKKALKVQSDHADAHNHLGIHALDEGRVKQAEGHFLAAIECGARSVTPEAGQVHWGFLENRPYLRALSNLALVRHRQERYSEEVEIYERMLRMNPGDHQGVRWLLGEGYHRLGHLEPAIKAFEAALEEPGCCYGLALALHQRGQPGGGLALVRAFAANRYVAPMLLGERWERLDAWHPTNLVEPEWAADYVERQGDLWRETPGAAEFLRRWWSAKPVRRWLGEFAQVLRELDGLAPGDKRNLLAARLRGLGGEGMIRVVTTEVEPAEAGGYVPRKRRPHAASLSEVRITRDEGSAVIEYLDATVSSVSLKLEQVETMTDAAILEIHNQLIESAESARAAHKFAAVEIPPGAPQITYAPESEQWIPRGDVLRCLIHDAGREARVVIDGRELTQAEFGRLLTTYSGWGMRVVFVPDDELVVQPVIELRDPEQPELPGPPMYQPWVPGGRGGPIPSA